jgi:hypothetical protein
MNQINDSTIIKHLPEYLHNNYNINFEVNSWIIKILKN